MGVPLLETPSDSAIALSRHGLVEYQKAWESQRAIHQDVVDGKRPNTLLLLEHPSVFTAGRRTDDSEDQLMEPQLLMWIAVVELPGMDLVN